MYTFYNANPAHKMKFSVKDFFSKFDQIRRKLRIWSHLLIHFVCRVSIIKGEFKFLSIINGAFLRKQKPLTIFAKKLHQPIYSQCTLSLPPEETLRFSDVFRE